MLTVKDSLTEPCLKHVLTHEGEKPLSLQEMITVADRSDAHYTPDGKYRGNCTQYKGSMSGFKSDRPQASVQTPSGTTYTSPTQRFTPSSTQNTNFGNKGNQNNKSQNRVGAMAVARQIITFRLVRKEKIREVNMVVNRLLTRYR